MTTSRRLPSADPLDHLLELCDVLREVELLPDGPFKQLYRVEARLQLHTLLFTLLLPRPAGDTLTTYDHHKEARHN